MSAVKQEANWIEVGQVEDVPRLGARVIKTDDGNIGLFRTAEDEIFALRDECPHKKGPLSQGIVHGKKVTCPLHNWNIQLDSGEAVAPDEGCTASFPIKIEGTTIYIAI
ncbi:MAG: nitrite reductase small subunit NirD [Gammaproteobacteria bacterium]|nr:nitrite reductase small subunit NirD [Gammaproteobacteria bacterium]